MQTNLPHTCRVRFRSRRRPSLPLALHSAVALVSFGMLALVLTLTMTMQLRALVQQSDARGVQQKTPSPYNTQASSSETKAQTAVSPTVSSNTRNCAIYSDTSLEPMLQYPWCMSTKTTVASSS